jgi:thiosulfate dehydrogenase
MGVVKLRRKSCRYMTTQAARSSATAASAAAGNVLYNPVCSSCHGGEGTLINFGTVPAPIYVGTVANDTPWEFLHKVRFGHPGAPMPATDLLRWSAQSAADIGAYAASLPQ